MKKELQKRFFFLCFLFVNSQKVGYIFFYNLFKKFTLKQTPQNKMHVYFTCILFFYTRDFFFTKTTIKMNKTNTTIAISPTESFVSFG